MFFISNPSAEQQANNKASDLEICIASEVTEKDLRLSTLILNGPWGDFFLVNEKIMEERFSNDPLFITVYDYPTELEQMILSRDHAIETRPDEKILIGLVESVKLKTKNKYDNVPQNYFDLTNNGYWSPSEQDADTVILVDITFLKTRMGKKGKGEASETIGETRDIIFREKGIKNIWTYTPKIESVMKWHMGLGAKDTGYLIENARPGFSAPDVNIMSYSEPNNMNRGRVYKLLKKYFLPAIRL